MRFALLGPVQVHGDGGPVEIRGGLRRTLLAALLLHRGSVVSADRLGELVWANNPPVTVTTSLYNQIMRLRQALGPEADRIRAVAPGYLIHVEPDELDLDEFSRLCGQARHSAAYGEWEASSERYAAALALWRGEMLADVPALHGQAAIHRFQEDRLLALQGRIEAELNIGKADELVGELRGLIGYHPLREAFHGQLMLALYRPGRQAEALEVYRDLRRAIVRELGVEPGLTLQELHHRILRSDPGLSVPRPEPEPEPPSRPSAPAPRQLPADTRLFTGRRGELDALVELAAAAGTGADAGMVVISAINGMGGIGKTALAVRAGHRVADRFPDGQLFIDLRGYDARLAPLAAEDALDYLLRSLGVPPQSIPADLGERAALYRSRLAGTRTLIVLDNAANTAQVQPLLPGTVGCLVLVTSRTRMMGLDDAHFFALDALEPDEAVSLLHRIAGPGRISARDPAVAELVALCGYMPLAVRIVAALLRHRPAPTVSGLIDRLRGEAQRLAHLRDEERDLASVFESSYSGLPEPEAQLFRLLGLMPGPDFDTYAAAHLIGADLHTAERRIDWLLEQNLLIEHAPGRFRLHDLLRAYARSLPTPAQEERACLDRVLDYYEQSALAAGGQLARRHNSRAAGARRKRDPARPMADYAAAVAWLRAERGTLSALLEHVTEPGRQISLTAALATFLNYEMPKRRQLAWHQAAVDAARTSGRPAEEAEALLNLAHVYRTDGDFDLAAELLRRAMDGYRTLGDRLGEANAQCELGRVSHVIGDYARAAREQERALGLYQELGDRLGEADALYELGRINTLSGDHTVAEGFAQRALALFGALGKPMGVAQVRVVLANIRRRAGAYEEAAELLEGSIATFRETGDRQSESNGLWTLGQIRLAQGDYDTAAELLERTLRLAREVGTRHGTGGALGVLGTVRLARGEYAAAAELLREAMAIFQEIGHRSGVATAQFHLARTKRLTGDPDGAQSLLDAATATFEQTADQVALCDAWCERGALALETAGPGEALGWYRRALQAAGALSGGAQRAEALVGVARCLVDEDRAEALAAAREAVSEYRRLGAPELAPAQELLASLESGGLEP
ncbi:MAG TPA: BTAD domain-containing putative transcriptional regulator [Actinospica sp.]|nr:BTAD domain-containing putative transcriptional regulator [Actinospica sp.]